MRIGINALFQPNGGSLRNLTALLTDWRPLLAEKQHVVIVFCSTDSFAKLSSWASDRIKMVEMVPRISGTVGRLVAEQFPLPLLIRTYKIDVIFNPANISPLFSPVPCVTTVQNMAPWCSESLSGDFGSRMRFRLLGALTALSAKRAASTIFLSHFAKDTLVKRYRLAPSSKHCVIYRARGRDGRSTQVGSGYSEPGPSRPYILTVSNLHRYKNIEFLIEAYARLLRRGESGTPQLVIVGTAAGESYREHLERLAERLCGPDRVVFSGKQSPARVNALMRSCLCFVFTSGCENCPNALIEALSCGAAIGCSQNGVMPEIAGDAALYFDPQNVTAIEGVLERLLTDPDARRMLQEKAVQQSLLFPTEEEMSRETLAVIERAGRITAHRPLSAASGATAGRA